MARAYTKCRECGEELDNPTLRIDKAYCPAHYNAAKSPSNRSHW